MSTTDHELLDLTWSLIQRPTPPVEPWELHVCLVRATSVTMTPKLSSARIDSHPDTFHWLLPELWKRLQRPSPPIERSEVNEILWECTCEPKLWGETHEMSFELEYIPVEAKTRKWKGPRPDVIVGHAADERKNVPLWKVIMNDPVVAGYHWRDSEPLNRIAVAYHPEHAGKLVDDPLTAVRVRVAQHPEHAGKLVDDSSTIVRQEVAKHPEHAGKLVNDPEHLVRQVVAIHPEHAAKLMRDPHWAVRAQVAARHFNEQAADLVAGTREPSKPWPCPTCPGENMRVEGRGYEPPSSMVKVFYSCRRCNSQVIAFHDKRDFS